MTDKRRGGAASNVYVAKDDYEPKAKGELGFVKGEVLKISKLTDDGWWLAVNGNKKKGFVPADLLAPEGAIELYDWCHGAISRNGAEYLLKQHNTDGMFLVRESQSQPGQYTLDVWSEGKAIHYRITACPEGYFFRQDVVFETIPKLIEHHMQSSDGLACRLYPIAPKAHAKAVVIGKELDKKWELKRDDVKLGDMLGGGNYGEVYRATLHGQTVAVKTIKEESMETVEFMKEAHVMKKLQHPNLVRLIGVCSQDLPMYIVQEYVPNGDLLTYLRRPMSRQEIDHAGQMYIATQIADGMAYMESQNVIHRDLAARNCLVGDELVIKIADFGMGRVVDDLYTAKTGTKMPIKWTAPEALCYDAFSTASDVWSFGILLWEIATYGDIPYKDTEARDVLYKLETNYRMEEPENCPTGFYDLMMQCWQMAAPDRPTFSFLKAELEELSKVHSGEKPDPAIVEKQATLKRQSSKRDAKGWRQEFEAQKPPQESSQEVDYQHLVTLTKEVFSICQRIFRYGEDDLDTMVSEALPSAQQLADGCKGIKGIDKSSLKTLNSQIAAMSKSKNKPDKARQAAEKMRDAARALNKSIKTAAL